MTNKDLFRLAKISLAARKKSTRSTVRGIAFGLILLIPVLYIAFGIFGDLNKKVNANPEVLYMNLQTASSRSGQADNVKADSNYFDSSSSIFASYHADNISENVKSGEVYDYEQIIAPFNPYLVASGNDGMDGRSPVKAFDMTVGDKEKEVYVYTYKQNNYGSQNEPAYTESSLRVPFAAIVGDTKFCPSKTANRFGDIYVSGSGNGFTGDGKGQVVLSETFIKALGYTADDFINKDFSVKYNDNYDGYSSNENGNSVYIDKDNDPDNNEYKSDRYDAYGSKEIYFCQNYKVVGIVKDEVTKFAMNTYGAGSYLSVDHIMTNMMFFTTASQYYDDGEVLEPTIGIVSDDGDEESGDSYNNSYYVATYEQNNTEFERLNKEYMAFGANVFNSLKFPQRYNNGSSERLGSYSTRNILVDVNKFNELDAAVNVAKAEFSALLGDAVSELPSSIAGMVFTMTKLVYNVFTYVVLALSVIGGIIFFASMVNLFNSIVHSVDTRRNYLGVLRAVGAKRSLINKMYLAESLTIFKRALIWILIFATAICVGIKFLLDLAFGYLNESPIMPFKMGISFTYIPVALVIALGVLLILGFAFSYGCSWKVSRDPITKTLAG